MKAEKSVEFYCRGALTHVYVPDATAATKAAFKLFKYCGLRVKSTTNRWKCTRKGRNETLFWNDVTSSGEKIGLICIRRLVLGLIWPK